MPVVKKAVKTAEKKAEPKKVAKKTAKAVVTPEKKAFNAFFKKNEEKLKKMRTTEEKCETAFLAGVAAVSKLK